MRLLRRDGRARTALVLAALVSAAGLAVVAAPPAETAASAKTVSFALVEWKLTPKVATVPAGPVTFVVRNNGTMAHEFVVLRSNAPAGRVPVKGGKAVETGRLGEIADIPKGASKRLTLKLKPGRYVLLCNVLGHYQAGQYAALRVR